MTVYPGAKKGGFIKGLFCCDLLLSREGLVWLTLLSHPTFIDSANLWRFSQGPGKKGRNEREDLYLGNSSKRVPILRGCKRCGGKGKEKEGVTLGETLKHLGLLGHHHTGRVARKADYRVCGLLTMIRNIRKKMIKRTVARLSRCHM